MSTKKQLQETANQLFAKTTHSKLFAVASRNEFFTRENYARLACAKGEEPVVFVRGAKPESTDDTAPVMNAADTIKAVQATTNLEELETLSAGETRKTVLAEIEKQREKLSAAAE